VNLGNAFKDGQQFNDALACYHQAIALKPGLTGAHENLGSALRKMCRFDDALISYQKALDLDPDRPSTHYNLASLMSDLGNFDEALAHCNRCLELQIDFPDRVLFLQGLIELVRGDFAAGWNHYERRWGNPDHDTPNRNYTQTLWTGEKLSQRVLFIWGEQGIGDEIMFAGLLPDVLRTGNRCILECDSRLQPLFARSFPTITVVSRAADEQTLDFGAHIPSGSLPRLFRSTHAAFRATPSSYLVPDPAQRHFLRTEYYDGRLLIGLAWKTKSKKSGHLRSIDLAAFAPQLSDGDLQVVNLQYGDADELAAEAQAAGLSLLIDRNVDQLSDMDIFAAQIAAMDLVITIDNSTAHLAGALGIPVWLLLPFVPDWRWQLNREDSPWYPTMRIFRQQGVSEWKPVLDRVHNALQQFRTRRLMDLDDIHSRSYSKIAFG
jgi:tetratricopeptide (TPR) repeat protein